MDDSPTQLIYLHQLICSSNLGGLIQVFIVDEQRTYEVIALYDQCLRQQAYGRGNCGLLNLTFSDKLVYTIHIRNTMVN